MSTAAARLSPLVRMVRAPNPGPYTREGTNTYIVGERAPVVIDPGPDNADHLARVLDEAREPSVVLITHRHPDHAEGAERFADMARAPLAAAGAPGTSVCAAATPVADGLHIDAGGATLVAMATPGHASDHLCFLLEEERALFSGDHVLGRGTAVVVFPDGDMVDYLASLDRARAAAPERIYPGHGPVVDDPESVLRYYKEHRLERERQVLAALDAGDETVEAMVARIYADVDPGLHQAAALSVMAHLDKLRREGTVREWEGGWKR